jgi:hypothetical protein
MSDNFITMSFCISKKIATLVRERAKKEGSSISGLADKIFFKFFKEEGDMSPSERLEKRSQAGPRSDA